MAYNEIYNRLKAAMTDDKAANEAMLKKEVEQFIKNGDQEGVNAAGALLMENMPEEQREEIKRLTYIDGKRLDEIYDEIDALLNESKAVEAKPLAEKLYKKIILEFKETEKSKFVSLRNPFEDNMYHFLYKPEKALNRTPFDFCKFITVYAYILTETGSPLDAIPILEKAQEYNPIDVSPKFELAEVYKILHNKSRLLEITRETMKVASSPIAIARCYANVGYILTAFNEYDDAVAFYSASAMMSPNPAIPRELQHIADVTGKPVTYPGKEKIMETMKKYDITFGPDNDVVNVAGQLASVFLARKDIPNALQALKLTYNLTLDDKIKELILKYDPNAKMIVPAPEQQGEAPDITQTVNESPEK